VEQHYKWSGKNCPRNLRSGAKGIDWNGFLKMVRDEQAVAEKPKTTPVYKTDNTKVATNQVVTLKKSATHYATGEKIPNQYKGKKFTVQQKGSNRVLLKELYSWVKISDLEGLKSDPKPQTNTALKVGSKVTLNKSASKYATGENIPASIKGKRFTVQQIKGDKILLKEIYSWVYAKDVGGSASSKPKPPLKVGSKVKIKTSARTYSRTKGVAIPSRFKNKSYTIQQIGKNDVLIKELYSWVKKSDLQ
jgi:IS30 family transposase